MTNSCPRASPRPTVTATSPNRSNLPSNVIWSNCRAIRDENIWGNRYCLDAAFHALSEQRVSTSARNLPDYICLLRLLAARPERSDPASSESVRRSSTRAQSGTGKASQGPNEANAILSGRDPEARDIEVRPGGLPFPRLDAACRSRAHQSCTRGTQRRLQARARNERSESVQQPHAERPCADCRDRRRWGRHGSTRYLWTREAVAAAIHYVVYEQGEGMAVFELCAALADARGSVAS